MNIRQTIRQAFLAGLMASALVGCVPEDSVEFSRDGAAGIAKIENTLYLVDGKTGQMQQIAQGDIQPFPSITPDGKWIAYCQKVSLDSFSDAVKLLPGYQVEVIDYYARQMQQTIIANNGLIKNKFPDLTEGPLNKSDECRDWVIRCLCENADPNLIAVLPPADLEKGKKLPLELSELIMAPTGTDRQKEQRIITASIFTLWRPVLSPGQKYVAYLSHKEEKDEGGSRYSLYLSQIQGDITDVLVADSVACGFAWQPDGKAIAYLENNAKEAEGFSLGILNNRLIADANDMLLAEPAPAEKTDKQGELAARPAKGEATAIALGLFNPFIKVAYGLGGKIFFSAAGMSLPAGKLNGEPRWSIFCYDPVTESIADILPRGVSEDLDDNIGFFTISPDGRNILLPMPKTRFKIYTLGGDAALSPIEEAEGLGEKNTLVMAPTWKGNDEICCMVSKESHFLKDYTGEKQDQNLIIIDTKGEFRSILTMPESEKK